MYKLWLGLALTTFMITTQSAYAGLTWDQTKVEIKAGIRDEQVAARFNFKNTGKDIVTLTKITPACGCTTVTLKKRTYSPGESGEIDAVVRIASMSETFAREILIETDRGDKVILTIKIVLPEIIKCKPALLKWRRFDPPSAQTISIRPSGNMKFHITGAKSLTGDLKVSIETTDAGKSYKVTAMPINTDNELATTIYLTTDIKTKTGFRMLAVHAYIRDE